VSDSAEGIRLYEAPPRSISLPRGIGLGAQWGSLAFGIALFQGGQSVTRALELGLVVALLGGVLGALVVTVLNRHASDAVTDPFFRAFAAKRGWEYVPVCRPLLDTPLLRDGDERYGRRGFMLPISGLGCALYEHTNRVTSGQGQGESSFVFLVAPLELEGIAPLRVDPRVSSHPSPVRGTEFLELESEELRRRFTVMVSSEADPVRIRSLFSPWFIVQLLKLDKADVYLGSYIEAEGGAVLLGCSGTITPADADTIDATVRLAEPVIEHLKRFSVSAREPMMSR